MKKILAVYDGTKYSEHTTRYALEMAKADKAMILGVFIHDVRYSNLAYGYSWDMPYIDYSAIDEAQEDDKKKIALNIELFKNSCTKHGVKHKVHLDKGVPVQEILRESAFADLLIIDSHISFFSFREKNSSPFLKEILADAFCPVLIIPDKYHYFDNLLIAYDGSPSSVHALKMFAYIFPEYTDLKVKIISVNESHSNHLKEGKNAKDIIQAHYNNAEYLVLSGDAESELINYLKLNGDNSIIIMGAYGRNALSRFFHQSISNKILEELSIPLFIAHQ